MIGISLVLKFRNEVRRMRRKIKNTKWVKKIRRMIALKRLEDLPPGSTAWFVETEIKYGGYVSGIIPNRISHYGPRLIKINVDSDQITGHVYPGGMRGGDRMSYHGYADKYSQYIEPFLKCEDPLVIVEIGILRGTGLAIWSDLFPTSRVVGLDIDLTHTRNNLANLRNTGAFKERDVELYEFDQFQPNGNYLGNTLKGERVDVCIDDAAHSREAILTTMESVMPHMKERFVYFIEDNQWIYDDISALYPQYDVEKCGELTIVSHALAGKK